MSLLRTDKEIRAERAKTLFVAWTGGMFIGLIVWVMRFFGRLKVKGLHKRRLRKMMRETGRGAVIISNHPSMTETFITPGLFFPGFLFRADSMPISTPDKRFYNARWFSPIRPTCLSVDRERSAGFVKAMVERLREKRVVILFAEGGRTYRGNDFKYLGDKRIRRFKPGIDRMLSMGGNKIIDKKLSVEEGKPVNRTLGPIIIPAWSEGGESVIPNVDYDGERRWLPFPRLWRKMSISFGKPVLFEDIEGEGLLERLEDMVLALSKKGG